MANEAWKVEEVRKCLESGVLTSSEWLSKTDYNVPVWMVCAMFNNLIEQLESGELQYALV